MSLTFGDLRIEPPVLLAPMAGLSDVVFRGIALEWGAGLVVSEMVASQEVVQARSLARGRAKTGGGAERSSVQLAGRDPYWMAEAARYCEAEGARYIDINMGCPAKRVTSGLSGSALMKEPDLALSLIDAVVGAVSVPVSVKMRLGWDDAQLNAAEIARRAENAGVSMISVHGRTRCQFYKGRANWPAIRAVVEAVNIPVVANGDIASAESGRIAKQLSGAAGVMVGRAAVGTPWLLRDVGDAIAHKPQKPKPSDGEILELMLRHYQEMLGFYGVEMGAKCARKHLSAYLAHVENGAALRSSIIADPDHRVVEQAIRTAIMGADKERLVA